MSSGDSAGTGGVPPRQVPGRVRLSSGPEPQAPARQLQNGRPPEVQREAVFDIRDLSVFYGDSRALDWTTLKIYRHLVTAVIGPSGCGKSTFIRC